MKEELGKGDGKGWLMEWVTENGIFVGSFTVLFMNCYRKYSYWNQNCATFHLLFWWHTDNLYVYIVYIGNERLVGIYEYEGCNDKLHKDHNNGISLFYCIINCLLLAATAVKFNII